MFLYFGVLNIQNGVIVGESVPMELGQVRLVLNDRDLVETIARRFERNAETLVDLVPSLFFLLS